MARFTCAHIKKDNTICGNKCCDLTGCYRHWRLYEKNIEKNSALLVVVINILFLLQDVILNTQPDFIH